MTLTKIVNEIFLQRYIVENFSQFDDEFKKIYGSEIDTMYPNMPEDRFPDLFARLKDGRIIPVEVEWKTSKFDHQNNSKFKKFMDDSGLIIVGVIEENVSIGSINQIKVDLDKFSSWCPKYFKKIIDDELKPLRKLESTTKERKPRLWVTLLTKKGGALSHFKPALQHETWGIQKNYQVSTGKGTRLEEIQKGDLIVFLAGLHGSYKSKKTKKIVHGRYPLEEWNKSSFNGSFDYVCIFRVTENYSYAEEPIIWKTSGKWKKENEVFPHRFKFKRDPMIILHKVKIKNLAMTTKTQLQNVVYVNFRMCDPDILVDLMHNSIQVDPKKWTQILNNLDKTEIF